MDRAAAGDKNKANATEKEEHNTTGPTDGREINDWNDPE